MINLQILFLQLTCQNQVFQRAVYNELVSHLVSVCMVGQAVVFAHVADVSQIRV